MDIEGQIMEAMLFSQLDAGGSLEQKSDREVVDLYGKD